MPQSQVILLAILTISTILYVTSWVSIELTSVLIIVALMVTGVLTPTVALSGFSSSATITVGAMFVLSAGLVRTGALETATGFIVRWSGGNPRRMLLLICIVVPLLSGLSTTRPSSS